MPERGRGINFAQQTTQYRKKEENKKVFKGMAVFFVILAVVAISWGAVALYKHTLTSKLSGINSQIEQTSGQRDFDKLADLLDMTSRLGFVSDMSQKQVFWSGFLKEIQGKMLTSVHLKKISGAATYSNSLLNASSIPGASASAGVSQAGLSQVGAPGAASSSQIIDLTIVATSLSDVAKQLASFQNSDKIDSVLVGDITLGEGGLSFTMKLTLAPKALERGLY